MKDILSLQESDSEGMTTDERSENNGELLGRVLERLTQMIVHQDLEVCQAAPSDEALKTIAQCPTTVETIAKAFELYADRPCFAVRAVDQPYHTVRYAEVWARVKAFASGLKHDGLVDTGSYVGIYGFGTVDWVVADLACVYLSAVSAPLQVGLAPGDLKAIIRQAEFRCIICGAEQYESIEALLPDCPSVQSLVVIDADETTPAHLRTMQEVEQHGREMGIVPMTLPEARGESDPLMTLYYTSGSTGTPKGAMIPESLFLRQQRQYTSGQTAQVPIITVGYMPLNHVAGRATVFMSIICGGLLYFVAKSDMTTLFDDMGLARPTVLQLVPRVATAIYQRFQTELVRRTAGRASEYERVERELLDEIEHSLLGDRLLFITTATAPVSPEVTAFLKRCFQVPVLDSYGSTEAGGTITIDDHVVPNSGIEWKLVDLPELGYLTSDQPYPRGGLHIKSPFGIPGYFRDENATRELFDDEGFIDTGDVVEQRGPDILVWIDRAKNVLKLAQGEFVAPSNLEETYAAGSPFIRQVFLHGDGFHSYLLAVITPDLETIGQQATDDASIKNLLRAEIERIAREEGLRSYEVPRDFLVERTPFSVENGLLTPSSKPARRHLEARYRTQLENMYAAIERAQVAELYANGPLSHASVGERVMKAVSVTLGLLDISSDLAERSFITLGGDSLSAVSLETFIHDITGVHVPVGFLLNPTSSVRDIVSFVEETLMGNGQREVTFADIHGVAPDALLASDLQIEKFLGEDEIEAARTVRRDLPAHAEVALLTGANGFVGRFLALELLERLSGEGKKLYALVRASTDAEATERFARAYRSDPRLAERFEAVSGNLRVLAGDLIKPRLGLSEDVYEQLAEEVDLIVHTGALVNHALGYEQLFEPNVLGTVRVIRLSIARRVKSIAYVSSVAALSRIMRDEPVREEEDLRSLMPAWPLKGFGTGYGAGYGASKWASELLLRDLHEKFAVPVSIFRASEILTHTEYRGQVNVPDFFTRLLAGIVYTGLAPKSFYVSTVPAPLRHFDGTPVDVVARSLAATAVTRDATTPFRTYHVVNPHHDDGISLDLIVDWVRSAGYPVERVLNYDEWFRRFHDHLETLPEPARQHSPLVLLGAWSRPQGEVPQLPVNNTLLLEQLRAIDPRLAEIPHVSETLIHRMLSDMAQLGIVERPPRRADAR